MSFPRYESYKDSGVEWLGEVPEYWEVCALKRIAMLKSGDTINSDSIEEIGDFPVFGGNGLRGYTTSSTHEGIYALIGRQGALCGNINYAQGKFWASEHAVVVSPLNSVETYWLGELLRAMNLNQYSTSAAQPGLSVEIICNLLVPLPPLDEQSSIATFLSRETAKIDALITEQQRLIELLKEKRQAVISHAVTKGLNPSAPMKDSGVEWLGKVPEHWTISALKQKVKMRYGDALASEIREEGDVEVFGSNGRVGSHCLANTKVPAIVVGRKGSYGKIVWAEKGGFVIDTAYAIDSDTTGLDLRWVYYWLQPLGLDSLSQDTGVPGLAREKAYEMRIVVPPLSEQQTIATFLDRETAKLDTLTAEAKTAITLLQERRTALISAAVTGKIDVRGLVSAKTEVKAETVPC